MYMNELEELNRKMLEAMSVVDEDVIEYYDELRSLEEVLELLKEHMILAKKVRDQYFDLRDK